MFLQLFHSFYALSKTAQQFAKNDWPKRISVDFREFWIFMRFGEDSSHWEFSRRKVEVYSG